MNDVFIYPYNAKFNLIAGMAIGVGVICKEMQKKV